MNQDGVELVIILYLGCLKIKCPVSSVGLERNATNVEVEGPSPSRGARLYIIKRVLKTLFFVALSDKI